jgi:class 3 adenylate cyclase
MLQTIDRLRRSVQAKNEAHGALERTHLKLERAKARLDQYAQELEQMVLNRTRELHQAQKELTLLNRRLESRVKEQVVQLDRYKELRRYLSPKLTQEILASDREFGKRPARKMMTVVFSDIRGFSSMTDGLESEELFHLLDRYLSEMIRIVYAWDGTLNKILGDGLLIFFNDPIPMEAHAKQAVLMAIEMQKKVDHLKEEWRHFGHTLGIGIGINTGFMTVGNIGCDLHRDYTVIGNQVNLAARLESLCQAGQILISQRTYSLVKESVKAEPVGKVRVKGIHYPVKTYRVVWEPASGHLEGGPS